MAGDSFVSHATRLSGLAGAALGWRPTDFWATTPAELAAVLEAYAGQAVTPVEAGLIAELKELFPDG